MNQVIRPTTEGARTSAWRLWIDRCGGFTLLTGDRLTVGGARLEGTTDVQVRSDWRRCEGTLVRRNGDYFWTAEEAQNISAQVPGGRESGGRESTGTLLRSGSVFPITGSATLRLSQPSPLSRSAVLSLDPPHRFDQHVDHVLLVDQTVLIGPNPGDHISCTSVDTAAVLVFRDGQWRAKLKPAAAAGGPGQKTPSPMVDLVPGQRISLGDLDMMLEEA